MKKILSVFAFALALTSGVDAQEVTLSPSGSAKSDNPEKKLSQLKLSTEQQGMIDQINADYEKVIKSLTPQAGYSPEAIREKTLSLIIERENKIMGILSPEQQAAYKSMRAPKVSDFNKVAKQLGLNADQISLLNEINMSIAEKENNVKLDASLPQEEKQKLLSYLQAERVANYSKILSPDQLSQLVNLETAVDTPASAVPAKPKAAAPAVKKTATAPKATKKN